MDEQCTPEARRPKLHELSAKRGEKPITAEQCALIVLAEYKYWAEQERTDHEIGAIAAASNIYAAITAGVFAPWHPGYPTNENKRQKDANRADA